MLFRRLRFVVRTIILEPRACALRARIAFWVGLISLCARWTSLPTLHKVASFRLRSTSAAGGVERIAELDRAIDSVLGMNFLVFRRRCWKRAIVLHRFLALEGIDSHINFGLAKQVDGTVRGHAWLERDGLPLLERDAGRYIVTFFSLPTHPRAGRSLLRAE